MGPYTGVDYNLALCPVQSRLQHICHGFGQPYARVDNNPMPESTLYPSQGPWIWSAAGLLVSTLVRLSMGKDDTHQYTRHISPTVLS